jgi:hypothetical protein
MAGSQFPDQVPRHDPELAVRETRLPGRASTRLGRRVIAAICQEEQHAATQPRYLENVLGGQPNRQLMKKLEHVSAFQIQDSPTGDVVIPCLEADMGRRRWARHIQ